MDKDKDIKKLKEDKTHLLLTKEGEPLATFVCLTKLCEFEKADKFPSYWTLVRKKKYPIITGSYKIQKINHY